MMSHMRADGRQLEEMRTVTIETGPLKFAEGSALLTIGDTRVLCAASVSSDVPSFLKGRGRGWITAEYSMLPRATMTRTPREISRGRPDGRVQEIRRLIGRSLRAAADLEALGEQTIIVDCDVIQADGGTRCASITGGYVALALACQRLREVGAVSRDVLKEPVAAISTGLIGPHAALDLDYGEDSTAEVDMNIVMTASGNLVEIQGTAEGAPFPESALISLLALARTGVAQLVAAQTKALSATRSKT